MKTHALLSAKLPEYAAGTLSDSERAELAEHLTRCAQCRDELSFWQMTAGAVRAENQRLQPAPGLAARVQARRAALPPRVPAFQRVFLLIRSQIPLIHSELWLATFIIILIGVVFAIIEGKHVIIDILAPLVAAACLAISFGTDHDPVHELACSTPTSPHQIVLARTTVVFGYNLILSLIASFILLPFLPNLHFGSLILSWLAPMCFLSALALMLSMWMGSTNAITAAYGAWILKLISMGFLYPKQTGMAQEVFIESLLGLYAGLWENPVLLISASALIFIFTLWKINRMESVSLFHSHTV